MRSKRHSGASLEGVRGRDRTRNHSKRIPGVVDLRVNPTVGTLVRYAEAVGKRLVVSLADA